VKASVLSNGRRYSSAVALTRNREYIQQKKGLVKYEEALFRLVLAVVIPGFDGRRSFG
jgi:hypothetical protein